MVGASLEGILRDKKERHGRERRVAELLGKGWGGQAGAEGHVEGVIDKDPTLWSFR